MRLTSCAISITNSSSQEQKNIWHQIEKKTIWKLKITDFHIVLTKYYAIINAGNKNHNSDREVVQWEFM